MVASAVAEQDAIAIGGAALSMVVIVDAVAADAHSTVVTLSSISLSGACSMAECGFEHCRK